MAVVDPALPSAASPAKAAAAVAKGPEKASVHALSRPAAGSKAAPAVALAEPRPEFAPDELPTAVLSRITAPTRPEPNPALAEAEAPKGAGKIAEGPEAIAYDKPSYAAAVESAALAEAGVVAPSEAYAPNRPDMATGEAISELQVPDVPTPTDTLTAGSPSAVAPGQAIAELAEPDAYRPQSAAPAEEKPAGPETATALSTEKPGFSAAPGSPELQPPVVPSPTESLSVPHAATAGGGQQTVTLEPASPRPPSSELAPQAGQPAAVATVKGPSPAGAVQIPSSVSMLKGLAKGSYYVQIGVYGTNDALQTALAGFRSSSYPLAVEKLTTKAGGAAYRLFVGPLSPDESGVVLIRIRSLGFKDAYVRKGS
jgi:hypothetical protein